MKSISTLTTASIEELSTGLEQSDWFKQALLTNHFCVRCSKCHQFFLAPFRDARYCSEACQSKDYDDASHSQAASRESVLREELRRMRREFANVHSDLQVYRDSLERCARENVELVARAKLFQSHLDPSWIASGFSSRP
jgi:hypothetical protein